MSVSSLVSVVQSWSSNMCSSVAFGFADISTITAILGLGGFVPLSSVLSLGVFSWWGVVDACAVEFVGCRGVV